MWSAKSRCTDSRIARLLIQLSQVLAQLTNRPYGLRITSLPITSLLIGSSQTQNLQGILVDIELREISIRRGTPLSA